MVKMNSYIELHNVSFLFVCWRVISEASASPLHKRKEMNNGNWYNRCKQGGICFIDFTYTSFRCRWRASSLFLWRFLRQTPLMSSANSGERTPASSVRHACLGCEVLPNIISTPNLGFLSFSPELKRNQKNHDCNWSQTC